MASPSEKLAESLEALKKLQDENVIAIRSKDLSRTHRQRLLKNGFLQEVIKGWYLPSKPEEVKGESTSWYASYWEFCAAFLRQRFNEDWCLSPEQSVSLHAGNWTVPQQLLVRSSKGNNNITQLPYKTALLDTKYVMPIKSEITSINDLRIFSLPAALIACGPKFFLQNPSDARTGLSLIRDASDLLHLLLANGSSLVAGRLAGAFRNIGYNNIADDILKTMIAAGYDVRENDPFQESVIKIYHREKSPYVNRMHILWQEMRESVIKHFPKAEKRRVTNKSYLKSIEKIYATDAYHSLSIEGYRVNPDLIERVRTGNWNPDGNADDREQSAALAARGYWQAFQVVEQSIGKVLDGMNSGKIFTEDHRDWYREMFTPSVIAGILKPADLAGYRRSAVYIRRSMHIPPNKDAVRDLMPAFCELLSQENNAAVRIVLGHFFFVYIHPYADGNGRIGRFLMNLMSASGNYPWIVVPVEKRNRYMAALEEASVRQNIVPFTKFLAELV